MVMPKQEVIMSDSVVDFSSGTHTLVDGLTVGGDVGRAGGCLSRRRAFFWATVCTYQILENKKCLFGNWHYYIPVGTWFLMSHSRSVDGVRLLVGWSISQQTRALSLAK